MLRNLFLILTFAASAQTLAADFSSLEERMSAAQFKQAGLEKLSAEELAELNTWLQNNGLSTSDGSAAASTSASSTEDKRGFDPRDIDDSKPGDRIIVSRIDGTFSGWNEKSIFPLTNGQIWKVVESNTFKSRGKLSSPQVTIESKLFDSWFLRIDGYNKAVRVKRIK